MLAGAIWGPLWQGTTVLTRCDNIEVVNIVNHGTSKNRDAMHLARCLAFIAAKFEFHIVAVHIKGTLNVQADALSRNNLALFHSLQHREGTPVPQLLLNLVILSKPDWTSKRWTEQWSITFGTV